MQTQQRLQHRGRRDHQGTQKAPRKQVAAKGVGQKTQPGPHRPGPLRPGSSEATLPLRQSRPGSRVSAPHERAQNAPETS